MKRGIMLLALPVCLTSAPVMSSPPALDRSSAAASDESPVRAELRVARSQADTSLAVAVRLIIAPGWHIGATTPGASGLPTTVHWDLPHGYSLRSVQWPAAVRLAADSASYAYHGDVAIRADIAASGARRSAHDVLGVTVRWGACADVCIPGQATLQLRIPQSNARASHRPASTRSFPSSTRPPR